VLDTFSKIDSLERYYVLDYDSNKIYILSEIKLKIGEVENGYFGDDYDIVFSPYFSLKHGFINMSVSYPAAGASSSQIEFVLNRDVYESSCYFTNHGGGYTEYSFRVNGVKKYSGKHYNPYESHLYR
jgi:hypothetical protein